MDKKQLIMQKSIELFAKQGFEATSIQQITEKCGISKGAFYLSFKSKEQLVMSLVDQAMAQFISDIDQLVNRSNDTEKLLHDFYSAVFHFFNKHSDFAKIFVKEQMQSFNEELLQKSHEYDRLINDVILFMVEQIYGAEIQQTKYDLLYCIKGFMNTYAQLFLFHNLPLEIDALSWSLVEKTNLLAKHATIPFISHDLFQLLKQPAESEMTKEQLIKIIEQNATEIEEPIVQESLALLKQELLTPTLSDTLVKGLLENIRHHPQCKWITYLLRNHFQFQNQQ